MKVCESWLREWVNPSLTGQQLADQLTMAGLEVDGRNPVAGVFNDVVVAKVVKTSPHPQADKLTLCEVDAGETAPYQIVCGAANVRAGLTVALARPGAHLPGDIHINETMLRGQLSQGMLCSSSELGLEDSSEGIMELPDDAPLGVDFREYLALNDHVLDIDLTPNRADCLSIAGLAREVAALNKLSMKAFPAPVIQPAIDELLTVHVQAPEACPQYGVRIIRGINPHATSPLWLKERLRRSGLRALHPVVDVINYVMLELGQPMHAFDLQAIQGDINVRYAHQNEQLELLDGQEITLAEQVLVIADSSKPLAMAGIMGGEASAVQAQTTDILLESAFFNPVVIAGVARRYGLCTDSSQRFERGVDPAVNGLALERATELLQNIVGGTAGPVNVVSNTEKLPTKLSILFNPCKVKQLTGLDISEDDMALMLEGLGMRVSRQQKTWVIDVPTHRFDIHLEVDLVEEIIRLYGYDNITGQPMIAAVTAGKINPSEQLLTRIAAFLSHRGYHETISYSFVDPALQQEIYPDTQTLELLNPISLELSQMRAGMWPGLIASMIYNMHRQQTAIRFFETGVVFDVNGDQVQERTCIAGLLTGEQGELNWSEPTRKFDFFDVKGDLQALFAAFNINEVRFVSATHPALHPGKTARVLIGDKEAGWLGVLHPRLLDALDVNGEVMLFELALDSLQDTLPASYNRISKYPQIRRDLSLLVNQEVSAEQIERVVREEAAADWLKAFDVFDVYTGESIPAGKKSLAIALTLQDDKRTLVDAEINAVIGAIISKLDDEFAIILRD